MVPGGPRTDQNEKEYVAAEKKKAKEEGLVDYVSTNDIITSYFLGEMDAGQMVRAGTLCALGRHDTDDNHARRSISASCATC